MHIAAAAVDGQPGTTVEHPAAPAADIAHLARPAEGAQVTRVEGATVVDREVPVAVGPLRSLGAGAAQGYRAHGGQRREGIGDVFEKGLVVHTAAHPGQRRSSRSEVRAQARCCCRP